MNDINHTERTHARLSASKIQRALLCAGSVLAEEKCPEQPSSKAAEKGTAIHELADALLSGKPVPADADAGLVNAAKNYVKAVHDFTGTAKKRYAELDVTPALAAIHPALGGTADMAAVGGGMLTVCDLKTGRVDVDPKWNPQLMTYALGAALLLKAPDSVAVRLAIYQEDAGGWKEWQCTYADLLEWRDTLAGLAERAMREDAPRSASAKACQYCRARAVCPALRTASIEAAREEFTEGQAVSTAMLDEAELCAIWADAVKSAAKRQLIDKPDSITGWRLRDGRKMVTWADEKMAAAVLEGNPAAWTLKCPSSVQKLGIDLPAGLVRESRVAASLVRVK